MADIRNVQTACRDIRCHQDGHFAIMKTLQQRLSPFLWHPARYGR
jgi:hypothetical protein